MARKEITEQSDFKYDKRLLDRYLRIGRVDKKDYEAYLKKLPDDESKGEYMEVFEEESDMPTPQANDLTFT